MSPSSRAILVSSLLFLSSPVFSQTIGTFTSVEPTDQTQNLVLPATHTFQQVIRSGDALPGGGVLGNALDFTGYVPIAGSSTNGYLSVSSETTPAECAILSVALNGGTRMWSVIAGRKVNFSTADLGAVSRFCAGTVTPANHIMVCEEDISSGDANGDGYQDKGWILEIDPATATVINQDGIGGTDKLWAMGRQVHEDVAIRADQAVAYWSADNSTDGYIYKFVPAVPGNFSAGNLFVLKTTSALGTGTWEPIANSSIADRNNTIALSAAAGAYNFMRAEGIEIGPDNKIYFPSTTTGGIYRFRDLGTSVDQLEVFVEPISYDVDGAGPFPPEPWGTGADNIAFDGEGNLWVLQDGDRNHIWVVAPDHTTAVPKVSLFATTPAGSEPTGITFSPDYKYLFMSVQHPAANTNPQPDAAGNPVVFDRSTAIVIARRENLGPSALAIALHDFTVSKQGQSIVLTWKVAGNSSATFIIQRSEDGIHFKEINTFNESGNLYVYTDRQIPRVSKLFYRVKMIENNGLVGFSEIKAIDLAPKPAITITGGASNGMLKLSVDLLQGKEVNLSIVNQAGAVLQKKRIMVNSNQQVIALNVQALAAGTYFLVGESNGHRFSTSFIK